MLAVVTGGLHRVGAAIAARLARDGYDLALHAHREGILDPDLADAVAASGVRAEVFAADLADADTMAALIDRIADRFGRPPTALVNSASIFSEGSWEGLDRAALATHLDVNFVAPVLLTCAFAARAEAGAAVVNILDQRIANPPVDQAAYTVSKLALASVTRVMARAYAPKVRVNAVAPGNTIPGEGYTEAQWRRLGDAAPLGHNPAPADIADGVAYLLGASATTGQILFVDGGASLESHARDYVHMMRD
jgi:pteridine reductase